MLKDERRCNWLPVSNVMQFDRVGTCSRISIIEILNKKSVISGHPKVEHRVLQKEFFSILE